MLPVADMWTYERARLLGGSGEMATTREPDHKPKLMRGGTTPDTQAKRSTMATTASRVPITAKVSLKPMTR